jgi:ketosteroid isomerase-like protein
VLGEWAYIWTHLSIVITPKNGAPAVKRAGNTLSILQKQNGSWLLVRDANMLAAVS